MEIVLNQITNPPNSYSFGLDFNYAQWPADSVLTLTNVPWNNDYRDVVRFDSVDDLNGYIDDRETSNIRMDKVSYVKPNTPVRIPVPFNSAYRFNYLRVQNPLQPVGSDTVKDYFYFIIDVRYVAPNTTEIVVQLDVWSTFIHQVSFGNCYVERGHIGIANESAFANYGRTFLNIPEGHDTGSDMQVFDSLKQELISNSEYGVLLVSSTSLTANPGSPAGTSTEFSNYQSPQVRTGLGSQLDSIGLAIDTHYLDSDDVTTYFLGMSNYPWITQGIMKAIIVPNTVRVAPVSTSPNTHSTGGTNYPPARNGVSVSVLKSPTGVTSNGKPFPSVPDRELTVTNFRDKMRSLIGARYSRLEKFLTFPYFAIELTTYSGSAIVVRPELVYSENLEMVTATTLIPGSERMETYVKWHNSRNATSETLSDMYDFSFVTSNFPTLPVNNNNALMSVAQSALSIANQRSGAEWSQNRAIAGATGAFGNTMTSVSAGNASAAVGRQANAQQTALANETARKQWATDAVSGVITGAGSGAAMGGGAGALAGGLAGGISAATSYMSMAVQNDARTAGTAISNSANLQQQNISSDAAMSIADTNLGLAKFSARGDYANAIGGINARVQEMASVQPSLSAQIGGDYHRFLHSGISLNVVFKCVDPGTIHRIGEYWLRYGYAVHRFSKLPENLKCMEKFTYWKLSETYITASNVTEFHKQTIRGILEKGVTVWSNPDDIGNVDVADNEPLPGITIGF